MNLFINILMTNNPPPRFGRIPYFVFSKTIFVVEKKQSSIAETISYALVLHLSNGVIHLCVGGLVISRHDLIARMPCIIYICLPDTRVEAYTVWRTCNTTAQSASLGSQTNW